MKTYDQFLTETNTTRAVSIAARLKGGINRLKAKIPGTQANKIQKITKRVMGEDELDEGRSRKKIPGQKTKQYAGLNRKLRKSNKEDGPKFDSYLKRHSERHVDRYGYKISEDEIDEGRAQPGKKLKSSWKSSEKGVDDDVVNRKVRRAVKSTAKTGAYNDKNITSKDPAFAKVDHYQKQSNKRYNSNFHVKPGRLGEDELGPNAEMVQQVKKNLKLEAIKPLAHGKIEKVGNVLRLRSTVGTKVTKKQHTVKEDEKQAWTNPYSRKDYNKGVSLATDKGGYVSHDDLVKHTKLSPATAKRLHSHLKTDGHINSVK